MRKVFIVLLAIIGGIFIGMLFQPLISSDSIYQEIKKFSDILNTANQNYVEEVDTHKLVEAAIRGMLNELDPHSVYISAEEMKKVDEDFQGSFDGIGVEFDILNDTIVIVSPIPGGPSEALGIQANDKIVKIDGENVVGIDRGEVPKKLKGPKGTKVTVDIFRCNQTELLHFVITRDKIPLYSVDAKFIIDGTDIGFISVNRFSATTNEELVEALNELKANGMKKLILDLRYNPGGYLNQAYLMADEFLKPGDTIVYTIARRPQDNELYMSVNRTLFEDMPLIVMINDGSASASEIVSGAIQDLDRGLVVGTTSFGKGLVQRQFKTGDGSAYRLTISKYYTPSGRCIQRPYQDKDKYRHLAGRFELDDGSYIDNSYEKIKAQLEKENMDKKEEDRIHIDSLPLYSTKSGRIVFGGGGITPDYIIKLDTINRLSREIRNKNLFFEYTSRFMASDDGLKLKEKYKDNFTDFLRRFQITEKIIDEFKKMAEEKEIKWDNSQYNEDKEYINILIKSNIARTIWTRNESTEIFIALDKQTQKAMELFPEAIKISKLK